MSRPISVKPDDAVVWDLAFLGFSDHHIASVIGCNQSRFSRRPDLYKITEQARSERDAAIVALWRRSSAGALRPAGQDKRLIEMVGAAEQRKIRHHPSEQRNISGVDCGEDAKGPTIPARPIREPQGAPAS